ncbi:hypothetical protein M408DRAFT_7321 [Serendipita vermifera MAFF 305830]|uniref:F-box domain-containing protein n=1 Tax=Serendipita vermifera MAFF 305830 TaxID=933852 RepID=A0A0C3BFB5_SERVB|nr:hypothetical protein M408DRAFT_7321 [Serendipita vermifera MAFF 305830]
MWLLENTESLPSESERILANESMDIMQNKREEALAKVEKFTQEAKDLEAEISKIRAWLAPIRRVPGDVLSLIFVEVCQSDWQAAMVLGAVCRFWRGTLLNTPRAWACIQIGPRSQQLSHALISLWLSRCGAFKLHVSLGPLASGSDVDAVCDHGEKIQCLSLFNNFDRLRRNYPPLEKLLLGPEDPSLRNRFDDFKVLERSKKRKGKKQFPSILNIKRFPKLVHLHLHSPPLRVMEAIAHRRSFPALTELHIHVKGVHWHSIIRYCARSLITLAVEFPPNYEDETNSRKLNTPVELPNLQNLHYLFRDSEREPTLPSLQTPNLRSYHQVNGNPTTVNSQPSLATFISLEQPMYVDWTAFPFITHLQIVDMPDEIIKLLKELQDNADLCPRLESVTCLSMMRFQSHHKANAFSCVTQRSIITGIPIQFRYMESGKDENYRSYFDCFTYCQCNVNAGERKDYYDEDSFYEEGDDEYEYDETDYDEEDDYDEDYGFWTGLLTGT